MVQTIQTQKSVTLMEPKELLRREFKTLTKREQKEGAFKANTSGSRGRKHHGKSRNGDENRPQKPRNGQDNSGHTRGNKRKSRGAEIQCSICHQRGHHRDQCRRCKYQEDDEVVFSATDGTIKAHETS
ncbi:TPA: hypothetical protein N0F65_010119 [Lagenidium giganteum]|uniref:CCHC-type domain-containing protein n=1 Tax=Lagenidium giganteum TaxID=4803 RepID=A0AAV2YGX1_9STRA|nr:TPA: hypothetical protein N0F65_010119 [Lagenidium giganteum]